MSAGYPYSATAKPGSERTAFAAADLNNKTLKAMLARVVKDMTENGPGTPEEITARMVLPGEHLLLNTVRARTTQLKRLGRVIADGTFGLGESGRAKVARLRLMTTDEQVAFWAAKAEEAQQ